MRNKVQTKEMKVSELTQIIEQNNELIEAMTKVLAENDLKERMSFRDRLQKNRSTISNLKVMEQKLIKEATFRKKHISEMSLNMKWLSDQTKKLTEENLELKDRIVEFNSRERVKQFKLSETMSELSKANFELEALKEKVVSLQNVIDDNARILEDVHSPNKTSVSHTGNFLEQIFGFFKRK